MLNLTVRLPGDKPWRFYPMVRPEGLELKWWEESLNRNNKTDSRHKGLSVLSDIKG